MVGIFGPKEFRARCGQPDDQVGGVLAQAVA
jgi:hypothetical protein